MLKRHIAVISLMLSQQVKTLRLAKSLLKTQSLAIRCLQVDGQVSLVVHHAAVQVVEAVVVKGWKNISPMSFI